jgi:hypothetical protein
VKKYILQIIVLSIALICSTDVLAGDPKGDPWLKKYRESESLRSSTIKKKSGEPVKFFNGFRVGGGVGLCLFHGDLVDYGSLAPLGDFSTYYKFGWHAMMEREIKFGINAKLNFENGTLEGGRLPGLQSLPVTFQSEFSSLSLMASIDLLGTLFRDADLKKTKTYLLVEGGIGITWFRSLSFWDTEDNRVRDFVGYTVTDMNPGTQRFTAKSKDKAATALNIPVGFTFGYRINYKTDVTFNYTFNSLNTDRLDTWSREWTSNDKYSYFGVGLRYNFNREDDQYPPKKKKEPKKEPKEKNDSEKWRLFGSNQENVAPREVQLQDPVMARKGQSNLSAKDQELEEIRMRMFELQLKLFQMQYIPDQSAPQR